MEQFVANISGKVRQVNEGGRTFLVAPVVLINPGVLPGSKGALLYKPEDVQKSAPDWNGMPLVIDHPHDPITNEPLSAQDPDRGPSIIEKQGVGEVRKSRFDGKHRGEAWFDRDKLKKVSPEVLKNLLAGKQISVSTGLFTDNVDEPGNFKGKPYIAVAKNFRPDHLAILPTAAGACSIRDGCGILVNKKQTFVINPAWVEDHDIWDKAKAAADKGDYDDDSYYAVVTGIYKKMGGGIAPATKNVFQEKLQLLANENPYHGHDGKFTSQSGDAVLPMTPSAVPVSAVSSRDKPGWSYGKVKPKLYGGGMLQTPRNEAKSKTFAADSASVKAKDYARGKSSDAKALADLHGDAVGKHAEAREANKQAGNKRQADYHNRKSKEHAIQQRKASKGKPTIDTPKPFAPTVVVSKPAKVSYHEANRQAEEKTKVTGVKHFASKEKNGWSVKPLPTKNSASEAMMNKLQQLAGNAFCPTGAGGGMDNSCGKDGDGRSKIGSSKGESYSDRIEGTQAEADREVSKADRGVEKARGELKGIQDEADKAGKVAGAKAGVAYFQKRLDSVRERKSGLLKEQEAGAKRMAELKAKLAEIKGRHKSNRVRNSLSTKLRLLANEQTRDELGRFASDGGGLSGNPARDAEIKKSGKSALKAMPGKQSSFHKRGGYAGNKMISTAVGKLKAQGFVDVGGGPTASPDGSYMGSQSSLMHPDGHVVTYSSNYGPEKSSNSYSMTLKRAVSPDSAIAVSKQVSAVAEAASVKAEESSKTATPDNKHSHYVPYQAQGHAATAHSDAAKVAKVVGDKKAAKYHTGKSKEHAAKSEAHINIWRGVVRNSLVGKLALLANSNDNRDELGRFASGGGGSKGSGKGSAKVHGAAKSGLSTRDTPEQIKTDDEGPRAKAVRLGLADATGDEGLRDLEEKEHHRNEVATKREGPGEIEGREMTPEEARLYSIHYGKMSRLDTGRGGRPKQGTNNMSSTLQDKLVVLLNSNPEGINQYTARGHAGADPLGSPSPPLTKAAELSIAHDKSIESASASNQISEENYNSKAADYAQKARYFAGKGNSSQAKLWHERAAKEHAKRSDGENKDASYSHRLAAVVHDRVSKLTGIHNMSFTLQDKLTTLLSNEKSSKQDGELDDTGERVTKLKTMKKDPSNPAAVAPLEDPNALDTESAEDHDLINEDAGSPLECPTCGKLTVKPDDEVEEDNEDTLNCDEKMTKNQSTSVTENDNQVQPEGGPTMATVTLNAEEREAVVNGLISEDGCCFEESEREVLNSLSDRTLARLTLNAKAMPKFIQDKIDAKAAKEEEEEEEGDEEVSDDEEEEVENDKLPCAAADGDVKPMGELNPKAKDPPTKNQLSAEDRQFLAIGRKVIADRRGMLINTITANSRNPFDKKELAVMNLDQLEKLGQLAQVEDQETAPSFTLNRFASYMGAATGIGNVNGDDGTDDDILPIPTINWKEPAKV